MARTAAVTVDGNRTCTKCGASKPLTEEHFKEVSRRGSKYFEGRCRECMKKYHREYRWENLPEHIERKRQHVDDLKKASCLDCGHSFPSVCMDFDHVRGKKRAGITKMIYQSWSFETLVEEIAKCELVCANCHRIRTQNRKRH